MLWMYNALLPAGRLVTRAVAPWRPKVRAGLAGRRGLQERLAALGAQHAGRLLWIHSTSVGEYEQARPVAALVRERRPEVPILHSFFSPSGYDYARRLGEAIHLDYLPEDTPGDVARALQLLRPRLLVIMKFDLWPNLIAEAASRSIPVLLLDATLRPHSWRSRGPARALYRELYAKLTLISAVSAADAARFRALVPHHPAVHVDGDTRFDQVMRRRQGAKRVPLAGPLAGSERPFTLVAGSTWGPDEARLLPAWCELASSRRRSRIRLVLVPHEPTPTHLEHLERLLERAGLRARRFSAIEVDGLGEASVVLVDRVGILAELYAAGDAAYVGGAFSTGVHNLMEPAIFGLPLLFGPRHRNAPEADMFLDAGAAAVIRSAADLGRALADLEGDAVRRRERGSRARAVVEANLGASERCFERLLPFLG